MSITEWLRKPRAERRAAIAAFREADKALQAYRPPQGSRGETAKFLDLNDRVNDLWDTVPFWRRW